MTSPYLSHKSDIWAILEGQKDQIIQKKTLILDDLGVQLSESGLSQAIECLHEFTQGLNPPLALEKLSLSNCHLSGLPNNFDIIAGNLKHLDLANNNFSVLPSIIGEIKHLEILDLSNNSLITLPDHILSRLKNLKVLSLKENNISYLPPSLADLPNLRLLEVAANPLIMPSREVVRNFKSHSPDLDWVQELMGYLAINKDVLNSKIQEQVEASSQSEMFHNAHPILSRSHSASEPRSKASRAARRMGLIINKPQDMSGTPKVTEKTGNTFVINEAAPSDSNFNSSLSHSLPPYSLSASASQIGFDMKTPSPNPPSHVPAGNAGLSPSLHNNFISSSRPSSRNRSRSNTLKDERHQDRVDTSNENNSNDYFRRLSTLQENPTIENSTGTGQANEKNRNTAGTRSPLPLTQVPNGEGSDVKFTPNNKVIGQRYDSSPIKSNPSQAVKRSLTGGLFIIKVSRKILFTLGELYNSIRRLTTFSEDKKTVMKLENFLHLIKTSIDGLVEKLDSQDESASHAADIIHALQSCVSSFSSALRFLAETISSPNAKIDLGSMRVLYLTLFGSFNEVYNSYILLTSKTMVKSTPSLPSGSAVLAASSNSDSRHVPSRQQLSINTSIANDFEEIDEKLYSAIDNATSHAQDVFYELNQAIENYIPTLSAVPLDPNLTSKLGELHASSKASSEMAKKVKLRLQTIRTSPPQVKRSFWDDINSFLRGIIQIFSTVKGSMNDFPFLNDIRSSMASLTKATKDVTILLEISSYKSISSEVPSSAVEAPSPQGPNLNLLTLNPSAHLQSSSSPPGVTPIAPSLPTRNTSTNVSTTQSKKPPTSIDIESANSDAINSGISTAPANSTGHHFAKHGINPFDGLIMANVEQNEGVDFR